MRKLEEQSQPIGNFIGGQWVPPTTGNYEPNVNPADSNDIVKETITLVCERLERVK